MKHDYLNIIGLMSGTSMDGIDISLVKTNGLNLKRLNENYFYEYSNKTKDFLLNILKEDININLNRKDFLDEIVTEEHFKALQKFDIINRSDIIGFHGQTIYHNADTRCSIQLGNPLKLAGLCNKKVVFDFRSNDIKSGGQGAPLAPIYHKHIIESINLKTPACILNIGGVTNLTFWDGEILIGFDTGPGNGLIDNYVKATSDKYFDKNGVLASKGQADMKIIIKNLNHAFFKKPPPKSLDRNSFITFYNELLEKNLSVSDTIATLTKFTVETIFIALDFLPQKIKKIIVTGGGYKNKYLLKCLKERLDVKFFNENESDIKFDYIESELIAFLSARSVYNLPFTFPTTTGVSKPSSGGQIFYPL